MVMTIVFAALLQCVGPGTVLDVDPGKGWSPKTVVIVGVDSSEDFAKDKNGLPYLSAIKKGETELRGNSWPISRAGLRWANVRKLRLGKLPVIEASDVEVPFKYEPDKP